jgi:hypothetical protein
MRPTLLLSLAAMDLSAEEASVLARAVYRCTGVRRPFLTTLMTRERGQARFRYDPHCLVPAAPSFRVAQEILAGRIAGIEPTIHRWLPGQALIIDNRAAVHARSAAAEPADSGRVLERIYVRSGKA